MKKILVIVLAVILTLSLSLAGVTLADNGWKSHYLTMTDYCVCGLKQTDYCCCCGPSSGVSIGQYYDDVRGYDELPESPNEMYDALFDGMDTSKIFSCYTDPYYYGYGFLEMARKALYYNFSFVAKGRYSGNVCWGSEVDFEDFWSIKNAIDNGWPVALDGNFKYVPEVSGDETDTWPCTEGHYIVIKGYKYYDGGYYTSNHRIVCTDSYSHSDLLELDWNDVVEDGLGIKTIIIKDEIPEDFEWGSDAVSLGTDGGDVDWTVTASGSSYAQIDDDVRHSGTGTRSGRFYRDGTNNVQAYYSEYQPIWRGFWLRKNSSSVVYTRTGDGSHSILVRVLDSASGGKLQYYDGAWKDTGYSITSSTKWYFIEFRVINWWGPYRYNYFIYVDGNWVKSGVPMHTEAAYNGITAYYSDSGTGSFWIDDIP